MPQEQRVPPHHFYIGLLPGIGRESFIQLVLIPLGERHHQHPPRGWQCGAMLHQPLSLPRSRNGQGEMITHE